MDAQEIKNQIIVENLCFTFKFPDGEEKGYFYTGITEEAWGQKVYVMCEMLLPEEMTISSFWKMSDGYLTGKISDGTINLA